MIISQPSLILTPPLITTLVSLNLRARRRASPEGGLAISTTTRQGVVRLSQTRRRTATTKTRPNYSQTTDKYKSRRSSITLDDLRVMEGRSLSARPKDAEALAPGLRDQTRLLRCKTK